jgi:hypothetical protein
MKEAVEFFRQHKKDSDKKSTHGHINAINQHVDGFIGNVTMPENEVSTITTEDGVRSMREPPTA